jgi:DNA-binding SARP family transcriptional activator/energy-coupling factor transporter ATP-binding protein EcfA2
MLRILLLGSPAIFDQDQLLDIKRRVPRALLFYLACHEDPVGREELINLFWPDLEEDLGRSNLRDTLSKLRGQLPDPSVLIGDHDRVGLDFQNVFSDVLELERVFLKNRWTILQSPANIPLPRGVYQQLQDAVRLWRSPAFMAGISLPDSGAYDTWVADKGARLEQISFRIMSCLAEHLAASGYYEIAVQWIRANLELDPFNEELNYHLIAWLNEAGRRSSALQEYDLLCKRLKRENLPLSPVIESLYLKIQDRPLMELPETSPVWPESLNLQYPLVGQNQAIQFLRQAFRRGQVVILRGEAGSGKTRLARALYRSLDSSARLLYCPTRSQEYRSAFQPLIDMLRSSVRPEEWNALAPVWTAALARILPELTQASSRLPFPPEDAAILNEAIFNLFQVLGRSQRVLLILDGAQWCDDDTFKALAYLINRNFFLNHGLLLITVRLEENNPAFTAFLNSLQNSFAVQQGSLEPLTNEEVDQLAQMVVGQPLPEELLNRLVRETMGNPFFLLETLRALTETFPDPAQWENVTHLPVPERIQAVFRQRMA